MGLKNKNKIG